MDYVLRSIEEAARTACHLPAIMTALTVPDIAGAVDRPNAGSQSRYAAWVDTWFIPRFNSYAQHEIDGLVMYSLRCKLLHEASSSPYLAPAAQKSSVAIHKRLLAFNIGNGHLHLVTAKDQAGDTWTILRTETFCADMVTTARDWLSSKTADPAALKALSYLVDIRTDVPPLSRGIPLICAAVS